MSLLRIAVVLWLCAITAFSRNSIPRDEYRARRAALRGSLADGVIVLFARTEKETGDLRSGFVQDPNFLYLTGWDEPDAILMLVPDTPEGTHSAGKTPAEVLFVPARNPRKERYKGKSAAAGDPGLGPLTGFAHVLPVESFEARLLDALQVHPRVYMLDEEPRTATLRQLAPLREFASASPALARLRMKKSAREIALIQRSTDATIQAFHAAFMRVSPGLHEYQLAATAVNSYSEAGCERSAFAPIVASGPNGTILHYEKNSRRIDAGELVVMDMGAECASYAADLTRTVPAGGGFSARQRELYSIVLGAQKAVIAAIRPGMVFGTSGSSPNSLWKIAFDYINSHGADLRGHPLGKYLLHGVSHSVGLDVHDPMPAGQPLEPGMVITVEPGIYIAEEGVGIRIEDTVLVTEAGAKVLSASLPKEPADIERLIAR